MHGKGKEHQNDSGSECKPVTVIAETSLALVFSRAVHGCGKRLDSSGDSGHEHGAERLQRGDDGIGGKTVYSRVAQRLGIVHVEHGYDGEHVAENRQSGPQNRSALFGFRMQTLPRKAQSGQRRTEIEHSKKTGSPLTEHRRNRRTDRAEPEKKYKDPVQKNIAEQSAYHQQHGERRMPVVADHLQTHRHEDGKEHPSRQNLGIPQRDRHQFIRRPQCRKKHSQKRKGQKSQQNAPDNNQKKRLREHLLSLFHLSCPPALRNQNRSAGTDKKPECLKQHHQRPGHRSCRQCVFPSGKADEDRIDNRKRSADDRSENRRRHVFPE